MALLLLLILVGVVAYFLARRDLDKQAAKATRDLTSKAKNMGEDVQMRFKDLTGQGTTRSDAFIRWVEGPGKADLPADFLEWFGSLTNEEKKAFSRGANNYVDGLGMSLASLTSGRLDSQPDFKKVFVETLVIYSNAYRKVVEAKSKTKETTSQESDKEADSAPEEVPVAEKARSRRGTDAPLEASPSAS